LNIVYAGLPLAGTSTTLGVLGTLCAPPLPPRLRNGSVFAQAPLEVGWRRRGEVQKLTIAQRRADNLAAIADALRSVDGIVYVADAGRRSMLSPDIELLLHDIEAHQRDPGDVPLVVQLNKRDLRGTLDVDGARAEVFWPGGLVGVVESIAPRGVGVRDALDALLGVIDP